MELNSTTLAGIYTEPQLQDKQTGMIEPQELGGEVWYQ